MRIVSFYSFKGGVGRSLCLLNAAYNLSRDKTQRIGLVDLDIEASGLNQILGYPAKEDRDLLALLLPANRELSELEQYVLDIPFDGAGKPQVFLLPTVADSALLDRITWNTAAQQFLARELFPEFAKLYDLDFIFVDCRSGLSEFATFALKIADLEVLVCRLDGQNRYGIKQIVEVCRAANKAFKIVVSACPDKDRRSHVRDFQKAIDCQVDYVLPYDYRLYYKEFIVSKENPRHELSKLYSKLADDIYRGFK
jgi:MinD-like ATPase involved in chromosome partitioning or flagellar assembly